MHLHSPDANIDSSLLTRKPSAGLMSVIDVARFLGVGRSTVYALPIPIVRIGRRRLYQREDVAAFATSRRCVPRKSEAKA